MSRLYGGPNGYGHIRRRPGTPQNGFHVLRSRLKSPITGAAELFSKAPWIFNQGPTSSCEGHAWSKSIVIALPEPLGWVPSPRGIYNVGLCIDRTDWTIPLVDQGAMTNQVERGVREWGVRAMGERPDDDRFSDCDPATISDEPKLGELEADAQSLILGSYALTDKQSLVDDACLSLDNGVPLNVAFWVDTAGPRSVEGWDPNSGPLDAPDFGDPHGGGHIVCLAGYRTENAKRIFQFANSWSETWGIDGIGEGSEEWLLSAYEHYAVRAKLIKGDVT